MEDESKPSFKYKRFLHIFYEMDLLLFKLKQDQCDICCGYDAGTVTYSDYNEHIKQKDEARASKEAVKNRAMTGKNIKIVKVDLQSLLVCPKLNASAIDYKMKVSCHNYTVYDMCTRAAMCYSGTNVTATSHLT